MINISNQIRLLRIEKGWTQKKLSEKVGVSQATICRAETSCDNIKWQSVTKILNILKKQDSVEFINNNFLLKDDEFFFFVNELKKNKKIWALINYDPEKSVKIFTEVLEKFLTNTHKDS